MTAVPAHDVEQAVSVVCAWRGVEAPQSSRASFPQMLCSKTPPIISSEVAVEAVRRVEEQASFVSEAEDAEKTGSWCAEGLLSTCCLSG